MEWKASWIWYPEAQRTPNFYFYARKDFNLAEVPQAADLHISAYTDYLLYVNGRYIGRGPNPSLLAYPFYDTYDISPALRAGKNVIAVLAHNYAVGLHWIPMGPGGLIAQAELPYPDRVEKLLTDESWRVAPADAYNPHTPRMMWSCQFLETFHFDRFHPDWNSIEFDDSGWEKPQVLGRPPVWPWVRLIPREIPFLTDVKKEPLRVEKGCFQVRGFHAVRFQPVEETAREGLYYAQTYLYSQSEQKAALYISCDDAYKAFLNGEAVLEQSYNEGFVREQQWVGQEDHDQMHNSVGPRSEVAPVTLKSGLNRLVVVVDQGPWGWGFGLGVVPGDPGKIGQWYALNFDCFLDLPFSSQPGVEDCRWVLSGPFESSGFKNSLELVGSDEAPDGGNRAFYDPRDPLIVTDYDLLMRAEVRRDFKMVDAKSPIHLEAGECLVIDLGQVTVGYPFLEVESESEAVIDIGCGNVLSATHNLCYMFQIRCVDRVYFTGGSHAWQAVPRREGRYMHISCRKGNGVLIKAIRMVASEYPVEPIGSFNSADEQLNAIWQASRLNTHLIMQESFQDSIRREGGLHNSRSMLHAFPGEFLSYGDGELIKKTIREEIRTQEPTGWWCGEGPTDNGWDEPTKAMWTVELIDLYYRYTGDTAFLEEVYEPLRCFLRYYSRLENKHLLLDTRNEYRDRPGRTVYIDDQLIRPPYHHNFDKVLFGYNIIYFEILNSMASIAQATGRQADASAYRSRAGYVRQACNRMFWDPDKETYVDWYGEGTRSDECPVEILVLALYYGICDEDKAGKVYETLFGIEGGLLNDFKSYNFTFGFYHFILELMFRFGLVQKAYDLLHTFYGSWLSLNMTTMGEHFTLSEYRAKKYSGSLGRDYNVHGYGTSALPHFYTHILGIKPLEPGLKRIRIAPQPGKLEWAEGSVYTPHGKVTVAWKQAGGRFELMIAAPSGCQVEYQTPEGLTAEVEITETR